jgi:hypothetical protein
MTNNKKRSVNKMPTEQKKIKDTVLNVPITTEMKDRLKSCAEQDGVSMAQKVRQMIDKQFLMMFVNMPSCADGTACRCPTLHSIRDIRPTGGDLLPPETGA